MSPLLLRASSIAGTIRSSLMNLQVTAPQTLCRELACWPSSQRSTRCTWGSSEPHRCMSRRASKQLQNIVPAQTVHTHFERTIPVRHTRYLIARGAASASASVEDFPILPDEFSQLLQLRQIVVPIGEEALLDDIEARLASERPIPPSNSNTPNNAPPALPRVMSERAKEPKLPNYLSLALSQISPIVRARPSPGHLPLFPSLWTVT